ncbi:MAG: permease [Chloroflexota bacterium]
MSLNANFIRPTLALLIIALLAMAGFMAGLVNVDIPTISERFQTFVTIFLGIFIEAVPFLLAGSIVSGIIEVFVDKETLYRFIPRKPLTAAISGAAMGMAFPVCECGVVPVTRRLYQKGLPMSVGIAFLLAAPVVNPVVVASTYAAYGWGPMLWGRLALSFVFAATVGFIFHLANPKEVLLPYLLDKEAEKEPVHAEAMVANVSGQHSPIGILPGAASLSEEATFPEHDHHHGEAPAPGRDRIWQVLGLAGEDFLDMARYLIVGSMLAALLQTFVPQSVLLAVGSGPVVSVVVMLVLAYVLSVCSTVDAFLSLAFVNSFSSASVLGFLVFGPMVDIKSTLLFLGVFRKRIVVYLITLPLLLTLVVSIYLNLNIGW